MNCSTCEALRAHLKLADRYTATLEKRIAELERQLESEKEIFANGLDAVHLALGDRPPAPQAPQPAAPKQTAARETML